MKTKNSNSIFRRDLPLLFTSFLLLTILNCNDPGGFHVNEVILERPGWVPTDIPDIQYKQVIVFKFNRAVSQSSLTAPGTVYIVITGTRDGRTANGISGSFFPNGSWGTAAEVAFVSDQTLDDLIHPLAGENLKFTITVFGTTQLQGIGAGTPGVVKDMSGEALDGDVNGSPGGNYHIVIEVVG